MELRDTTDVWFSELESNWEECDFYWFSWKDRRKNGRYRRYGDLEDGRHFGAGYVPAFGDPWASESAIVIVDETGELRSDTSSYIKEWNRWPKAMAASPDGKCIAWLTEDGLLGVWNQNEDGYVLWNGECLNERLAEPSVEDVKINDHSILEIRCGSGKTGRYMCGADTVLSPWEDGWRPVQGECGNISYALEHGQLDTCPDWLYVLISEMDSWGAYEGRGVRNVCFEHGLERIEGRILADNPGLESVVIPESVRFVDWQAFGNCTNLKNLVIEGDLSRVLKWDREAFEGCPCNGYYTELHRIAYRETVTDPAKIAEDLHNALRMRHPDRPWIEFLLELCSDDAVLYDIACSDRTDTDMLSIRGKAARLIRSRDYRYALSSHILNPARTPMILDLYDPLEGDEIIGMRTILTDPDDGNKTHMLLYCENEDLLMLGWLYVFGARRICADRLHAMGSPFPEAYIEMTPEEKTEVLSDWLKRAAEFAYVDILPEDETVRGRISGSATVDSEPLHLFLSIHHPRKAVRWWHARKLENPVYIAYVGSWTSDLQIKEELSEKIRSTGLITEMIFGDLSGVDLVFAFRKPDDLTLQDRFCAEIMKNNPDRTIREHVRTELLRGSIDIPGVDLTEPDPLYKP